MRARRLACGLVVMSSNGGAVTSGGARYAVAEADGEIIETAPSLATAHARASEIALRRERKMALGAARAGDVDASDL